MPDFLAFDEGRSEVLASGLPATCYFLLSTKPCSGAGAHAVGDTLAGGVGEIAGTGYARKTDAEPSPVAGVVAFPELVWQTGAAVNWPASVKSCVLVTTANNAGKALCAWNLVPGGGGRDLSQINTTERFTPTLNLQNL